MKLHEVKKRVLCGVLTFAMIFSSTSFQGITVKAASTGTQTTAAVHEGEYYTGVFAGRYGIDQLFDYVMSTSRLNSLPFDASWGTAYASSGHQLKTTLMKGRYFVLKYSGDSDYPIALCMYENDGTPVVAGRSKNLLASSHIGKADNVCLTTQAKTYMKKTYTDGIEGVMALCEMGKADQNGLYFSSSNGFGYYLSGNQGRDVGEKITWVNADTDVTMKKLAGLDKYSYTELSSGEYAVMYQTNGDAVRNMPEDQVKKQGVALTLSDKKPLRKGYRFKGWNTAEDGSGDIYAAGSAYTGDSVLTLYAVWERYYESGLFSVKLSKSQFFDNVTSANRINGLPYDASWGTANWSTGHQFTESQVEDRYFLFRYSGDSSYPFALFMYENDGTPVVATGSGNLSQSSYIGQSENVCMTKSGQTYMKATYKDGYKGLICQGKITKYDKNGVQFVSPNGFGYYVSCNRGYKRGDYIAWSGAVTSGITPDVMDSVDTFSDMEMLEGEYALNYNVNTTDEVTGMPDTQRKEDLYNSVLTMDEPQRSGYTFIGWNTKKDGSGKMYMPGARYEGEQSLTMYAIWEKLDKSPLSLEENGTVAPKVYKLSNRTLISDALDAADDADAFYSALNQATMTRYMDIKGGAGEDDVFSVKSSDESVVECSVEGSKLTMTGKTDGFAYVTVTDETSGQLYRSSVYVETLKEQLYIIRPVNADNNKSYLTDSSKTSFEAKTESDKKVTWDVKNSSAEKVKQLSNGDAVVWKPTSTDAEIGVTYGACQLSVPLTDMESGETAGAYPINNYEMAAKYRQNLTLSDSFRKVKNTTIQIRSFIVDTDGNVISGVTKNIKREKAVETETIALDYSGVTELTNADVVTEIASEDESFASQLVRYPIYRDGVQKNTGTTVMMKASATLMNTDCTLMIKEAGGAPIRNVVLYKGAKKTLYVYSKASQAHSLTMTINGKEIKPTSVTVASVEGMKYEWVKTVFEVNTKNTKTGKYTPQFQVKAASGTLLMDMPGNFTVSNVSDIGTPAKPTEMNFCGTVQTPTISAGEIINRNFSFDLPKVLPMKIAYQDTKDPMKKTFMIAIGTAGLDEDHVVSVVTDTINDLRDNKMSKKISGYAFGTADYINGKWVLTYTGGGIAGSLGYEFGFDNSTVIGIVPVYYGIKVGCSVSVDALLSGKNAYHDKFVGMNFQSNNLTVTSEYDFVSDIIVGVQGYVGASGGIGFDAKLIKLKFGPEGQLTLGYDNRIITFKDLDQSKTYYGGCLNFTGDIALTFEYKGIFVHKKKRICGTGFTKNKTFKDWANFPSGRPNLMDFANMSSQDTSKVVQYSSMKKGSDWTQYIDPDINPVLSESADSMGLAYSDTLDDLASINPAISAKSGSSWTKPEELTSWRTAGKSETINSVDYAAAGDLNVLAFDSVDYDPDIMSDGSVDTDELNAAYNSSEVHVYVNGKHTCLTSNKVADMAPEVAVRNGKAIVVWESDSYDLTGTDVDALQKDAMGEKKLCYSYYDGKEWSTPAYLERGEIKGVQAYDIALGDDGTAMVLASMGTSEKVQERELYSYMIEAGTQKSVNRITCNNAAETQPRVKYVTDQGGSFLAAWKQSEYENNELSDSYLVVQGYQKDGSANDISMTDESREVSEKFDFARGGDTIKDSAVYWQASGEDSAMHTYVKYMNAQAGKLSMKYSLNSVATGDETLIGSSVAVDGDKFTVVACAQEVEQKDSSNEETPFAQTDDEEKPARLISSQKQITDAFENVSADTFGQNIEKNSTINVTLSFVNAGRKAMDAVTVKQGDTIVAADLPIHLESGESGQVSFSYTLGDTLKNETFDLVADNGAKAETKLTLLGADIVVGSPEVTEVLSGGERIVQTVLSNAGTKALTADDTIRLDLTSADQEALSVRPISESASYDADKKQLVIKGSGAMEAINRGEYILQFGYKPEFDSESDNVSVSVKAAAYTGETAMDELNLIDNSAAFSIVKPSVQYDTQLTYSTVVEDGKITQLRVNNQYETPVEKSITILNGTDSKKINVVLSAEEYKTYEVGIDASAEVTYDEQKMDGEETPNIDPSPEPTVEPTAEPTVTPGTEPTKTPGTEPTKTPAVEPSAAPSPEPTKEPAKPTEVPSAAPTPELTKEPAKPTTIPTVKPTAVPSKIPVATAKPTKTPKPAVTVKPTKKPVTRATAKPTVKPTKKPVTQTSAKPAASSKPVSTSSSVGKAGFASVKNKAGRKLVVMIKPAAGADGYCVQYSTNKKFKKPVSKLTKKYILTIKKLKKKKTYYVRVCGYKIDTQGNLVFGSYSKAKKVKIKK